MSLKTFCCCGAVFGGSSEAEPQSEVKELNEQCPVSSLLLPLPTQLKCAISDTTGHSTKRKVKLVKRASLPSAALAQPDRIAFPMAPAHDDVTGSLDASSGEVLPSAG
ncbi:hypothetical protein AOLI_G00200020 [Acnodon oligacanthus]